ncbi:hypothetical protein CR513_48028, partial [Mucuna pruriens]
MAENKKLKEAILDSRTKEVDLGSQLYLLQEKLNLMKEEMARDRQYQEDLEAQRGQGLIELVEECRRVADLARQAQETIEELETEMGSWIRRCVEMVDHAEERVQIASEEVGGNRADEGIDEQDDRAPYSRSSSSKRSRSRSRLRDACVSTWDEARLVEEGSHQRQSGNPFPKALVMEYNPASQSRAPLIIQLSSTLAYIDNHVVPQRYREGQVIPPSQETSPTLLELEG